MDDNTKLFPKFYVNHITGWQSQVFSTSIKIMDLESLKIFESFGLFWELSNSYLCEWQDIL